jgi:hypothetical protein
VAYFEITVGHRTNLLGFRSTSAMQQQFDDKIGKLSMLRPDEVF